MGRLDALKQVILGAEKQMKTEMTALEKLGIKNFLDQHNVWLERKELDAFSVIEDPLNDADFKIQTQNRLIIGQYKYISLATNPKLAYLLAIWRRMMSRWALMVDEKRTYFGVYAKVEIEELYPLSDGKVLLRKSFRDLSPKMFQNMYFQYNDPNWQKNQIDMMPEAGIEVVGANGQNTVMKPRKLEFKPLEQVMRPVERDEEASEEEEREMSDRLERFGNVEIIPRGWYVYSWLHPEKFSFPNTPIVIQTGPQQPAMNPRLMNTGNYPGGDAAPNSEPVPGISTA